MRVRLHPDWCWRQRARSVTGVAYKRPCRQERSARPLVRGCPQVTGPVPCTVHGLATWFDVFFNGAACPTWLSTAPGLTTTHWFQLRCVLQQPLFVMQRDTVLKGTLRLVAHARQSYDVHVTLVAPPLQPGLPPQVSSGKFDLKEPYYRQLQPTTAASAAAVGWALHQTQQPMH